MVAITNIASKLPVSIGIQNRLLTVGDYKSNGRLMTTLSWGQNICKGMRNFSV